MVVFVLGFSKLLLWWQLSALLWVEGHGGMTVKNEYAGEIITGRGQWSLGWISHSCWITKASLFIYLFILKDKAYTEIENPYIYTFENAAAFAGCEAKHDSWGCCTVWWVVSPKVCSFGKLLVRCLNTGQVCDPAGCDAARCWALECVLRFRLWII